MFYNRYSRYNNTWRSRPNSFRGRTTQNRGNFLARGNKLPNKWQNNSPPFSNNRDGYNQVPSKIFRRKQMITNIETIEIFSTIFFRSNSFARSSASSKALVLL